MTSWTANAGDSLVETILHAYICRQLEMPFDRIVTAVFALKWILPAKDLLAQAIFSGTYKFEKA